MYFNKNANSELCNDTARLGVSAPPRLLAWLAGLVMLASFGVLSAQELQDLRAANLGSGQTQLALQFSDTPPDASIFAIDSPPRIALDLPGVSNRLAARTTDFNLGPLLSVTAVESGDRTRVILNLSTSSDYRSHVDGNNLILTVGTGVAHAEAAAPAPVPVAAEAPPARPPGVRSARPPEITDIDFRRGVDGQGRLLVELSRPGVTVDVREQAGRVELIFPRVLMEDQLVRRLNVTDFATPVISIDTVRERDDRVRMVVNTTGEYDVLSYQTDRTYVLEVAPLSEAEREALRLERQEFIGERLSLNFQDIEVRSVLQLLADFTDLNIVVSDSVTGNITLRLNNVPWDQALDIILTTRGLDKRVTGNVMYVAPREEIAARERLELEALRDQEDLAPLRTEFISVNFTQAESIRQLIYDRDARGATGVDRRMSFLSDRGSVAVDMRTNTLIIRDTADQIEAIRRLVSRLDVPTQQVLIETRVVIADDNYRRDLGVRFGVSGGRQEGRTRLGTSGTLEGATGITTGAGIPALGDRLNVALPVTDGASVGFSILRPNILLDLELSALQVEGRGEVISSPRVITANGQKARIEQGEEIPFLSIDQGTSNVEFRDALLLTEVTPQITPNGNVIMDIKVTKNEVNFQRTVQGNPTISKREVETQVVVGNGETVVLGGVYEITSLTQLQSVPFFGELPFLKHLFRNTTTASTKAELLIFVTPRVLD
ncbi:type IV pilus secretin PilQ [Thioalkalivibrio sp.]|uniref:type IV pilus secretin PilQ n=1 Tax=Thioalkalivibrio sp. TaxID=2093813 RepID=UPI0025FAF8B6|nr:type IV pilus secretin PilQ [Thioalkalivibrio sp.]